MTTFDESFIINSQQFSNVSKGKLLKFKFITEKAKYNKAKEGFTYVLQNIDIKFYGAYIQHVRLGGYIVEHHRVTPSFLSNSKYLTWFNGRLAATETLERLLDLAYDLKNGKFEQKKYMNQEKVA